jgi:carbonic anhydrase
MSVIKYPDLGLSRLLPEWKSFFTTQYLLADTIAGITVAFVAIPLSLAIALASGYPPGAGLITAIIAGIVCALFGGTKLAVSGPAAAMAVLIGTNVEKFGIEGVVLICLFTGVLQLLSGVFGFGKFARYVPLPVIAGFTAGIGVIIMIGQLPRAFGLLPPKESDVISVFTHLNQYFHEINGSCLLLVVLTIIIIRGLPKILPRIPSILPAVAFVTFIAWIFNLSNIPVIGSIPDTLPSPRLPDFHAMTLKDLVLNGFAVFILASLETLLSASAIDKIITEKKHDPDQELIGQGLGNLAVSFFGGIPVTSVIARSATNVRAGGKTRRASIIHSIVILLSIYFIAPIISIIPVAALAGVLFSVAFSMINRKEFEDLWNTSRAEAFIYVITLLVIVFTDLIAGVQAGMIAAAFVILLKSAKTYIHVFVTPHDNITRMSLSGSLTFLSTNKIRELEEQLKHMKEGGTVILDLSHITNLDSSGASSINDLYQFCNDHKLKFFIKGLPQKYESLLKICMGDEIVDHFYLVSESDLRKKDASIAPKSAYGRLIHGFQRFYAERRYNDKRLFKSIAKRQDPHTLFIACSDSRIIPSLITSADPGELFIIRNVGNFIPPYNPAELHSEAVAIEFSLRNFDIRDIVVCGHASCGAMQACRQTEPAFSPANQAWIEMIKQQLPVEKNATVNDIAKMNVIRQLQILKEYPTVQEKLNNGTLYLHGWFFDFDHTLVYEWNEKKKSFEPLVNES